MSEGVQEPSTGNDSATISFYNASDVATDLHAGDQTGVSNAPGDRAFTNTASSGMGSAGTGGRARHTSDLDAIDTLKSFTFLGWFKTAPDTSIGNGAILFDKWNGIHGFSLRALQSGRLSLIVNKTPAPYQVTSDLAYGAIYQWLFFAVTYDGTLTSDNVRFYIGSQYAPVTQVGTPRTIATGSVGDNTSVLGIANFATANTMPFDGYLDNLAIFGSKTDSSGVLTLAQLETQRQADLTPIPTNPADVTGPDGRTYPDWTRAGVQGGLPNLTQIVRTITAPGSDDAATIESVAAQAAAVGGGVVLIKAGDYHLNRPVVITADNVVLRGEGPPSAPTTRLYFDFIPPAGPPAFFKLANNATIDSSTWIQGFAEPGYSSFTLKIDGQTLVTSVPVTGITPCELQATGGAVLSMVGSNSGAHTLTLTAVYGSEVRTTSIQVNVGGWVATPLRIPGNIGGISFVGGRTYTYFKLAQDGLRGDTTLRLTPGHTVVAGDRILLTAPATAAWNASVGNACLYLKRQGSFIVTTVNGDILTLNQPLRIDFPIEDGSQANCASVSIIRAISGCGVENLYYEQTTPALISGISFACAENCWTKNVQVKMAGRHPICFVTSKFCQVQSCVMDGAWQTGADSSGNGSAYAGWDNDFDCLMDSTTTYNLRHAPQFQWSCSGCVIRNGTFLGSDAQFHAGWVHECLLENNVIDAGFGHNSYGYGIYTTKPDDAAHGPIGPRNVIYNNDVASPLDGIHLGGENRGWLILHNRFAIDAGSFILAQNHTGDHDIHDNVVCFGAAQAGVNFITANCDGLALSDNRFYGPIMESGDLTMSTGSLIQNTDNTVSTNTGLTPLIFPDGGFENSPSLWTFNDNGISTITTASAYVGNKGLHINDASTTLGASAVSEPLAAQPDATYQIRMARRSVSGAGLVYRPQFLAGGKWIIRYPVGIVPQTYWTAPSIDADAPAGTTQIRMDIVSKNTVLHSSYFDDVRIALNPQIIYNKDFESGLTGWDNTGDNGMSTVISAAALQSGSYGLRITDNSGSLNSSLVSNPLPATPGLTYQLRFWTRVLSGSGLFVDMIFLNSTGQQLAVDSHAVPSAQTTYGQRLLRAVAPSGTNQIHVRIRSNGIITADLDTLNFLELQPRPVPSVPSIFSWQLNQP